MTGKNRALQGERQVFHESPRIHFTRRLNEPIPDIVDRGIERGTETMRCFDLVHERSHAVRLACHCPQHIEADDVA